MSEAYLGEIRLFAGTYAPVGWLPCDGRPLNIADNQALFAVLGTMYGGNGSTTFGLPDLSDRLPVGQGSAPGLTPRTIGQQFGSAEVALSINELPSHNHAIMATTDTATTGTPGPSVTLATLPTTAPAVTFYDSGKVSVNTQRAFSPSTLYPAGVGVPHHNLMPCVALNYIICTQGIFPQQS